ncbi:MAG: hypothetical protein HXS48_27840 [Theionarchaea archaeon]|nr:MAG: hypothetical protein AYK19_02155 [Theionarchaea archaeon DG-70-1]MBU7030776.1 hypothetical protein [Theionarchaea archaeon]
MPLPPSSVEKLIGKAGAYRVSKGRIMVVVIIHSLHREEVTYEALDGKFAPAEMSYKYRIVPTQITFFVSGKALFNVVENGRFILREGDYTFFRREIVYPALKSALEQKSIS